MLCFVGCGLCYWLCCVVLGVICAVGYTAWTALGGLCRAGCAACVFCAEGVLCSGLWACMRGLYGAVGRAVLALSLITI